MDDIMVFARAWNHVSTMHALGCMEDMLDRHVVDKQALDKILDKIPSLTYESIGNMFTFQLPDGVHVQQRSGEMAVDFISCDSVLVSFDYHLPRYAS